jgi:hypothetical protein
MTNTERLFIIKKCGCQKFDVLCFFLMFGCCLFVCRLVCLMVVFQWSSRTGFGDEADSLLHC